MHSHPGCNLSSAALPWGCFHRPVARRVARAHWDVSSDVRRAPVLVASKSRCNTAELHHAEAVSGCIRVLLLHRAATCDLVWRGFVLDVPPYRSRVHEQIVDSRGSRVRAAAAT